MLRRIALIGICGILLSVPSNAEAQNHVRARLGLSVLSGLIGVEYQMDNLVFGLGYSPLMSDDTTEQGFAIGMRYFSEPDASGLTGGLSFENKAQGYTTFGGAQTWPAVNFTGGYRFVFGEKFDLTLGAGYGIMIGDISEAEESVGMESGRVAIDFSLGFAIQ